MTKGEKLSFFVVDTNSNECVCVSLCVSLCVSVYVSDSASDGEPSLDKNTCADCFLLILTFV